ncbi:MAG: hypothetical protein AUK47_19315 [Deltaproteobacteria bacterium CG2_30_63_29]|nr:MAG: hypothetical protein AUK47_19315 [Deltaproteobacteria bacterium CG2_30_63_29]
MDEVGTVREKLARDIVSAIRSDAAWDEPASGRNLVDGFEALAAALQTYQAQANRALQRYLKQMGPWGDVFGPPLPTEAFKRAALVTFPLEESAVCFRSSGTTVADRGRHYLRTLELVNATIDASFRRFLLPDLAPGARIRILVLAPTRQDAPESSLSHMLQHVVETCGDEGSRHFVSADWTLDVLALRDALGAATQAGLPVLLLGTSFAFVHFLDAQPAPLRLAEGSRLMDTGGTKGRTRSVPRAELHSALSQLLGLAPGMIVGEYGMSELSSQLYEDSLLVELGGRRPPLRLDAPLLSGTASRPPLRIDAPLLSGTASRPPLRLDARPLYQPPPWCLVRVVDPLSLVPLAVGEVGHIALFDLANLDSVAHLLTGDQGRIVPLEHAGALNAFGGLPAPGLGLELLGRAPMAAPKGCSIALDAALNGELELAP